MTASSLGSARSSVAPICVAPLRLGRRSSHMVFVDLVASSLGSARSSVAPTSFLSETFLG